MRLKHAALFVLLFTIGVTGQEEPLPVVTPRATPEPEVTLVALEVEPIRETHTVTLAEAARARDYVAFDALYREAKERGTNVAPFETLHELWTYSVTDPVGAFYGPEMYERLSRAYPGFAAFIEEHRLVDSNGNVFYPTSETREFVLARALEGRSAPRVLIAEANESAPAPVVQPKPVAAEVVAQQVVVKRNRTERTAKAVVAAAAPPTVIKPEVKSAPAQVAEAAPVAQATPAVEPATPAIDHPAVEIEQTPVAATSEPVVTEPVAAPVAAAVTPAAPSPENNPASRGLLLLVVGIMGAGLLAVMLRAPRETLPVVVVTEAAPEEKPAAPVEPIRRPEAAREANRASGSRG